MTRVHVCSTPGCPNLAPCEVHSRPKNAPWSKDRDHAAHLALRRQLIKQSGPICQRCGWNAPKTGQGLEMHHWSAERVSLLCSDCHKEVDSHAR